MVFDNSRLQNSRIFGGTRATRRVRRRYSKERSGASVETAMEAGERRGRVRLAAEWYACDASRLPKKEEKKTVLKSGPMLLNVL